MHTTTQRTLRTIALSCSRETDKRGSRAAPQVGRLLVGLLCLCAMLCATTVSPAAAAGQPRALCSPWHGCGPTAVLADTSDSEAEEPEEEPQEGAEEAATAEVEAEEAEDGEETSSASDSDNANSVAVSHLELTARATAALARRLPTASAVAFSFTLSATANVRVTIVRQTSTSGHKHWATLPDSLTLPLAQGHVARSLKGRNHLSPGRYRLTVKPTDGRSRSIFLSVHT
ncbi:MAG TPA: hypothetical protein VK691_02195 [Solirubrobacteraceae bacterium]|jgi:hypothetical protein|nr:hypothetical protein [Solirubrobacteraceae bacterium]